MPVGERLGPAAPLPECFITFTSLILTSLSDTVITFSRTEFLKVLGVLYLENSEPAVMSDINVPNASLALLPSLGNGRARLVMAWLSFFCQLAALSNTVAFIPTAKRAPKPGTIYGCALCFNNVD